MWTVSSEIIQYRLVGHFGRFSHAFNLKLISLNWWFLFYFFFRVWRAFTVMKSICDWMTIKLGQEHLWNSPINATNWFEPEIEQHKHIRLRRFVLFFLVANAKAICETFSSRKCDGKSIIEMNTKGMCIPFCQPNWFKLKFVLNTKLIGNYFALRQPWPVQACIMPFTFMPSACIYIYVEKLIHVSVYNYFASWHSVVSNFINQKGYRAP